MIRERFSLEGRTALVTGASRGIGRAIAIGFAEHGADLVLVSRKRDGLEAVAQEIEALGRRAQVFPANLGSPDDIAMLAESVSRAGIVIDVLVNNAGANPVMTPLVSLGLDAFRKIVDVNLTGPFLLTQALAPAMVARGRGVVINIASNGGVTPAPGIGAYCTAKAALIHLTRAFALELGPSGVRVNAIAPGLIETRMAQALLKSEAGYEQFVKTNPLRRHGQPEEIAGVALMLATDAGSYVNGEVIVVDGGSSV